MNLKYKLEFSNQATKFIKKLKDKNLLHQFLQTFDILETNPYYGKFLQADLKGYHSVRVAGVYRVIYKVLHNKLLIYISDIAHRKDSYK